MSKIEIKNLVLGSVSTNCYFAMNPDTKELIIIDPADRFMDIDRQVMKMGGKPVAVLLTHGHYDHILAAEKCREKYHIPVYAHYFEESVLANAEVNLSAAWDMPYTIKPDVTVKDQEVLKLAGYEIKVLHTPGHTTGSVCYYIETEQTLFSGDTLFAQSYGRTDFPTSSSRDMKTSIRRLLTELPDQTRVYPGHNEETSIAVEKRYNPLA
ncbi:MAG: MBL fold metallo-hydrolase [Lachnospiraceae bacterium]|nr:MBL fold metallo-hydrolase [Lachnospiraceae bacterium]